MAGGEGWGGCGGMEMSMAGVDQGHFYLPSPNSGRTLRQDLFFLNQWPGIAFPLFNKHFLDTFYVSLCTRTPKYRPLCSLFSMNFTPAGQSSLSSLRCSSPANHPPAIYQILLHILGFLPIFLFSILHHHKLCLSHFLQALFHAF